MALTRLTSKLQLRRTADARLVLPYELRCRSRLRAELPGGEAVGVMLERGQMLRNGDQLLAEDGRVVEIVAAAESVSVVRCADSWQLARAAYHLGNRHVSLQIGPGWLRYVHDHVLDDMLTGLGLTVTLETAPFEPEAGAYSHETQSALRPASESTADSHHHHDHGPAHSHGGHHHTHR